MKPYFIIAIFILVISVLGAIFFSSGGVPVVLFLFAELASLVSFYIFFSVIIPSLFPEYRNVDENFNCGASELYLNQKEMYGPKTPFGGMKDK
jgi:hypothetical protein